MSTSSVSGFTGSSTFSTDLQNAVTRAVAIASLPIQQLTAAKNAIDSQATEIGQFGTLFTNLQTAVKSLSSAASTGFSATASNPGVAQASLTGNAYLGTYTVQVLDPGAASSAISLALPSPVNDPSGQSISQSNAFTLTVDGNSYTLNPSAQSLKALADSINASGAPVHAIVVNLGSPNSPDYHLIVQSTALGDVAIQLNDGSTDLLGSLTTGSAASYTVNGQPPGGISSDSRTVTIAPGLDVSLDGAGTTDITVSRSSSALSDALSSFVDAFNAIATELDKNHGQSGGALTANSTLLTIQNVLRQVVNYSRIQRIDRIADRLGDTVHGAGYADVRFRQDRWPFPVTTGRCGGIPRRPTQRRISEIQYRRAKWHQRSHQRRAGL